MRNRRHSRISRVYRPHWLAYWKLAAVTVMLSVLGVCCLSVSVSVAVLVLALAGGGAVGMCLYRSWHLCYFTKDRRLVYQHGFLGRHTEVVDLFGRVTQTQIPLLGKWLNIGDVYLGTVGPDLYVRHISRFDDFRRILMAGG